MTILETKLGRIEGIAHNGVQAFLGVRFAEPPVGPLRFQPPVRSGAWEGTYDATAFGHRAVQPPSAAIFGPGGLGTDDEDCLFLNVFTPAADGRRRPVLCWIHGGAYTTGSANDYDGSQLAKQGDVVVVSINYRLGPLGFLDLSSLDPGFAGSAANGFRDQIAALQWIRDNIESFGGDPGNVTIFGESAGGGSVLALIASPSADGLYHKAIAHSPGGVNLPPANHLPGFDAMLAGAGSLLDRLMAAPARKLVEVAGQIGMNPGDIDGVVVTRHPTAAVADRSAAGVPLLVGSNLNEGTLFSAIFAAMPGVFEMMTPFIGAQVMRSPDASAYLAAVQARYPDDSPLDHGHRVWVDLFRRTAVETAEAATTAGPGGWLYRFDVPTTLFGDQLGATHASEIAFTFNWINADEPTGFVMHDKNDPALQKLAQQWSDTVLAFARTGDPNGAGLPEWPKYDATTRSCMVLHVDSSVVSDPDAGHRELWTV